MPDMRPPSPVAETGPARISEHDGVRFLHLGGSAVQSAMRIQAPFALELEYTRAMMAFLLFHPRPRDIALIGLGGGSIAKFIHRHLRKSHLTAVEIHPEVVAAAHDWFHLPADDARLRVVLGDGAAHVRDHPDSQDVLLVDGYGPEGVVDALATPGFYQDCRAMLRPGGVAVFNLWGSDENYLVHDRDLARAFDRHILRLPAATKANIVVLAFRAPLPDGSFDRLSGRAQRLETDIGLEFDDFLVRMGYRNPCSDSAFLI
jgi:spermidine synthase